RYRGLVGTAGNGDRVGALYANLKDSLDTEGQRLESGTLSTGVAFVTSLGILLREGLEALLVVGAILTVLVRTGQREGLPYLHAGWVIALAFGGVTWYAARELIAISGAGREAVEGLSGLVAAVILFYVSYWFVTKVEHRKWQAFIRSKVDAAVNHGALWVLAFVVFLAVYREVFETILFYQALWGQAAAGPGNGAAIVWGIVVAAVGLLALGWGIFKAGIRLPLRAFFLASSVLLFVLAVVLAGKGVLGLQEAGWIEPTPVSFPRIGLLGIYPYAAPLLVQGGLIALMVASLAVHYRLQQSRAQQEDART
ncbi:MAG TPA: FTR1 family protein, partial [Gammaproteobacteria bacterium]|nr:FTR1 family protein [Gammaproteobacteria bacterium]